MSPLGSQFETSSPILTMTPQPADQAPFGSASSTQQQVAPQAELGMLHGLIKHSLMPQQNATRLSRKRSRDEAAINLDPPSKTAEAEADWIYGSGTILTKSEKGYMPDSSSQTGIWVENEDVADKKLIEEPKLFEHRSHKVQRVIPDAHVNAFTSTTTEGCSAITNMTRSANETPIIDDFTIHLGIGWRKISDDADIQAAARGWARYIENHYPVTNARIRCESKGLQSYLVEASEGIYLFSDSLRQGRFVSNTVSGALNNLQTSPPTFDSAQILVAFDSPSPSSVEPPKDAEMGM